MKYSVSFIAFFFLAAGPLDTLAMFNPFTYASTALRSLALRSNSNPASGRDSNSDSGSSSNSSSSSSSHSPPGSPRPSTYRIDDCPAPTLGASFTTFHGSWCEEQGWGGQWRLECVDFEAFEEDQGSGRCGAQEYCSNHEAAIQEEIYNNATHPEDLDLELPAAWCVSEEDLRRFGAVP